MVDAATVAVKPGNSADDAIDKVVGADEGTKPATHIRETSTVVEMSDCEEDQEDPSEDLTAQVAETPKSAVIEGARKTSGHMDVSKDSGLATTVIDELHNKTEFEENKIDDPFGGEPVSTTTEADKMNGGSFDDRSKQLGQNIQAEVRKNDGPGESDESKDEKEPENPTRSTGPKTLFIGNLPYNVDKDKLIHFFKDVGEVVEVRLGYHDDGRSKGYGHVDFATAEELEKALTLNGKDMLGRPLKLDIAHEKGSRAAGGEKNPSEQRGKRARSQRVFIRGFDTSLPEEEIRSTLMTHFEPCGEIATMSIPMERGTSTVKGIAYIEFNDTESFEKALDLDGTKFRERHLTVQEANPKEENRGGGSKRGGGGGGSKRSGGGGGGSKRSSGGDRRSGSSRYDMGYDRYGSPDSRYMPDSRYIPDSRYMPDGRYGYPDSRYGMPDYGMPDSRYGMPESRYGMSGSRYGIPDDRYGMPGGQMGMGGSWYGEGSAPYVGSDIYGRPVGGGRGGGGTGGHGRGGARF